MVMQGDAYGLLLYGSGFSVSAVAEIEFAIGNLIKSYPGEVTYDTEQECFVFPLTQQETFAMENRVEAQARVKLSSGEVIGTRIGSIDIQKSITRTVL